MTTPINQNEEYFTFTQSLDFEYRVKTRYDVHQFKVSTTPIQIMYYSKERTAYTILVPDNAIIISPDQNVTASNGLYIPTGIPFQFMLPHGFDTRMPMWAVRATSSDGTATIREDFQDYRTYPEPKNLGF